MLNIALSSTCTVGEATVGPQLWNNLLRGAYYPVAGWIRLALKFPA